MIVLAYAALQVGAQFLQFEFGAAGTIGVFVAFLAAVFGWRAIRRARARRGGAREYTPEMIRKQIANAGLPEPAFDEDGGFLGSSIFAVNQRSKLLEVNTQYDVFNRNGEEIANILQTGQSRFKRFLRIFANFDQYFTHTFDVTDPNGQLLLRLRRPSKVFRTTVHVYDSLNQQLGSIQQQNVFGKINFVITDTSRAELAWLRAENWRAWDFRIEGSGTTELARVTKTWEGFVRTIFSNADTYVVRIHNPLPEPLRSMVVATAIAVDLALKQDARGFGA